MTEINPRLVLEDLIHDHGTQSRVAVALGISKEMVSHLVTGRRSFSDTVLFRMGLRRVVVRRVAA